MHSLIIVYPYFGKFPNYFNLFIKSLKFNSEVDFIFITDNKKIIMKYKNYSPNIFFKYMSFNEITTLIKNKICADAIIDTPYKLCDYKSFYSIIFEDIIKTYAYWGFGDIDLIFGKITDYIHFDSGIDIYYKAGHLQIFRNTNKINNLINTIPEQAKNNVFLNKSICYFDERQYSRYNMAQKIPDIRSHFDFLDYADIYPYSPILFRHYNWEDCFDNPSIYLWDNGCLYVLYLDSSNNLKKANILYVHFRKRFFYKNHISKNKFYVLGNKIIHDISNDKIIKYLSQKKYRYSIFFRLYRRIFA